MADKIQIIGTEDSCYDCPALDTEIGKIDLLHKCGEGCWQGTKRTEFNTHPKPGLDCPYSL